MRKKILLADDDFELCQEIKGILTDEGFEVETVFNGLDVLPLVSKEKFDLLVLDFKLPGQDGLKVLESVKSKGIELKVIILSGSPVIQHLIKDEAALGREERLISYLADAVIAKPCDPGILISKINELLY